MLSATSAYYGQGVFTFFKVELLWSVSPLKKVKREAAAQAEWVERTAFQTENAL